MAVDVVHLKRRVQNADNDMFEWRKCECSVTGDGQLVLELVSDDDPGDMGGGGEEEEGTLPPAERIVIDLTWQLQSIEQRRKCHTRCELQYIVIGRSPADKTVRSEELMAPSPKHCQQWIELVMEAEKKAKRRQSIRQGTATASAVAIDRGLDQMSMSTVSSTSSSTAPPSTSQTTATREQFMASSTSSRSTAPLPPPPPPPAMRVMPSTLLKVSQRSLAQTQRRRTSRQIAEEEEEEVLFHEEDGEDLYTEQEDAEEIHAAEPLPREVFARRLASVRKPQRVQEDIQEVQEQEEEEPSSSVSSTTAAALYSRVKARVPRSTPSSLLSSSASISPASSLRRSSTHRLPIRSARQRSTRPPSARSSAAAVAASLARLRRREHSPPLGLDSSDAELADANVGEELDILFRVESALRQLERENAAAKEKELALTHQVQSLTDALRIRTAEKKHLENQLHQIARDKEKWKQAAQRAEQAMAQMQDELAIAQEETQLVATEQHRLRHQNKELLSQVHRLDSYVYGRF